MQYSTAQMMMPAAAGGGGQMYSTALMPGSGSQQDVAVSEWMPVGAQGGLTRGFPVGGFPTQQFGGGSLPTSSYNYPLMPNQMRQLPAAPLNTGSAVSGNNFYSAWPPDKSKTYGVSTAVPRAMPPDMLARTDALIYARPEFQRP